jgi:hypothetical protein
MSVTIYTGTGFDSSLNLSNTNFRRPPAHSVRARVRASDAGARWGDAQR